MIPKEKKSRTNNVTNLEEVRLAKAKVKSQDSAAATTDTNNSLLDNADLDTDDRHGNRRFDTEKVARIKAAIAAGEYKIDASRVADKFIEHDRNQ